MSLRSSGLQISPPYPIPIESAAYSRDLLFKRWLQVGKLGVDFFEQLEMQRLDGFLKQSIEGQSLLFFEIRDRHSRTIQCNVGVEDVL